MAFLIAIVVIAILSYVRWTPRWMHTKVFLRVGYFVVLTVDGVVSIIQGNVSSAAVDVGIGLLWATLWVFVDGIVENKKT